MTDFPRTVDVQGVPINFVVSGAGPDLLLIHGNSAHVMWWHAVVPLLESRWRLIRLDLSGHGDSGSRASYDPETWTDECVAVLDAVGVEAPVVVGHSQGGRVALVMANRYPRRVRGLVVIDSAIRPPERYLDPRPRPVVPRRYYGDANEGLDRFHLLPRQPHPPPEVLVPVARHGLRQVGDRWTWKHDPNVYYRFRDATVDGLARAVDCPVGIFYGRKSVVVEERHVGYQAEALAAFRVEGVMGAHHHVILDAPTSSARLIDELAEEILLLPRRRGTGSMP